VTGRSKIGWHVPSDEWDRFTDYVADEHGQITGYVGREVERAMREWVDTDHYAAVEALVDDLVEAAGRTPANLSQKKSATTTPPTGDDTTKVQTRVDTNLKDDFAAHAKRDADERPGLVLARALRARRHGGRARRLRDKLERVGDDAEALLAEVAGEDAVSLQEKRTIAICNRLPDQFTRDDLDDAIEAVAGGSEPTVREYTDRVFDRLDYVEHPNNGDLYIPEAEARGYGVDPNAPAIDRFRDGGLRYGDLSRDDKVRGVRIAAARRATSNGGRAAFDAATVERDVFDGHPSPGHASKLVDLAADADGFDVDTRRGKKRLLVDLGGVTDGAVLDVVDGESKPSTTASGDESHGATSEDAAGSDVDDRMNQLMNAKPATDGGTPIDGDGL
jgi:hypothetical protein